MEEQLVSFELAKLAKEKGFNYMKANCYGDNMCYKLPEGELINALQGGNNYILAPTQSLLQKWLREVYKIHLIVEYSFRDNKVCWDCNFSRIPENESIDISINSNTYEEALEVGLQKALKLIKV